MTGKATGAQRNITCAGSELTVLGNKGKWPAYSLILPTLTICLSKHAHAHLWQKKNIYKKWFRMVLLTLIEAQMCVNQN